MKIITSIMLAFGFFVLFPALSFSQDCEVKNWTSYKYKFFDKIIIEGVTDCVSGNIVIQLYNEKGEFVGTDSGFMLGYTFEVEIDDVAVEKLSDALTIQYTIRPGESREALARYHRGKKKKMDIRSFETAISLFHLDNKRYPSSLDELLPKYLKGIPKDPFTGEEYIYSTPGPDGKPYEVK